MEKSHFGSNLRYLRKLAGLTQGEFGEVISVKKSRVSLIESGEDPSLNILRVTANYFNVTLDEMVETDLQKSGPPHQPTGKLYNLNTEGVGESREKAEGKDVGGASMATESPPSTKDEIKEIRTEMLKLMQKLETIDSH